MKNKTLAITYILILVIGKINGQYCTSDKRYTEVPYFDSTEISVAANVQFGSALDHLGNPYILRMDIYYPNLIIDPSPKRPFLMLFHGGGFTSGDKQSGDIKDLCIHMARRGFVCATVNYRLGYNFTEYGQYKARYRAIQDGHAAMRHIVNNANAIRVDTNWLFIGGQSAGSLVALGMVYADQSELDSISLLYNTTTINTELGSIYNSGNNLTNTYRFKGIFNNWGGVTKTEMDVDEILPTVAFHGELDTIVKIDSDNSFLHYTFNGSRAIHNSLIANNKCSELTVDTVGEHGIFRNSSSIFRAGRASCFFKSVFCNNCSNFYSTDSIPRNCSTPVSIEEQSAEPSIRVYPNPIDNVFRLSGVSGVFDIGIYNHLGQLVFSYEKSDGEEELILPPGIYLLKVKETLKNTNYTVKLIKY